MSRNRESFRRYAVLGDTPGRYEPWGETDGATPDHTILMTRADAMQLATEGPRAPMLRSALLEALRQAEGKADAILDISDPARPIALDPMDVAVVV